MTKAPQQSSIPFRLEREPLPGFRGLLASLALCCAVVVVWGAFRIPLPGVNEPHYLGKALHFWMPQWCAGDFFYESANAHWFFYAAFGWLTRVLSLPNVAIVGRGLAWIAFGIVWTVWFRNAAGSPGHAPAALAAVLAIAGIGSLSGEWLVGGIESKCFAYPCLFLGLNALAGKQTLSTAAWFGLSTSWHPLVGGWGLLAVLAVEFWRFGFDSDLNPRSISTLGKAAGVFFVAAAPGLIPALWMLFSSPSRLVSAEADAIQFTHRLAHHLDPRQFAPASWLLYGGLCSVWWSARFFTPKNTITPAARFFDSVTLVACFIAMGATALTWLYPIPSLLKFYPFRMADAFVPIATCLAVSDLISHHGIRSVSSRGLRSQVAPLPSILATIVVAAVFVWGLMNPVPDYDGEIGNRFTPEMRSSLIDACHWIRNSTPEGSIVTTPRFVRGFKWWGHRAEFVSQKDCPQDAVGIIEWRRRTRSWETFLDGALSDNRVTIDECRQFADRERVDFWLAGNWLPPIDAPLLYKNDHFSVYSWPPRTHGPP